MSKTILLADDDPSVRRMVGRVLQTEDYEVIPASSGNEAVSKFLNGPPDLVLLDLNMPEKDGWEAWHLMSSLHPMVPVIVITARPNQFDRANRLRIDALMEKPLDLALLLETVSRLLAEPDAERLARVSAPSFRTNWLNDPHRSDTRREV
jgi:DNA-binding response OmpR family regulator